MFELKPSTYQVTNTCGVTHMNIRLVLMVINSNFQPSTNHRVDLK